MNDGPNIFQYSNYRKYLADWVLFRKKQKTKSFSMRAFAKKAGLRAHNLLPLVIKGQRNLSLRTIPKFLRGLGLDKEGGSFFEELVLMNQAQDIKQGIAYYQRLVQHPDRQAVFPMEKSQLGVFRHWMGPVILEMSQISGFRADAHWLAEQFSGEIDSQDLDQIIHDILAAGLVSQDANGGWASHAEKLDTGDGVQDFHVYSYHEQALEKASDALRQVAPELRHFQVMTLAVPIAILPQLIRIAKKYENEIMRCVDGENRSKDEVLQIGMQLFPVLNRNTPRRNRRRSK